MYNGGKNYNLQRTSKYEISVGKLYKLMNYLITVTCKSIFDFVDIKLSNQNKRRVNKSKTIQVNGTIIATIDHFIDD